MNITAAFDNEDEFRQLLVRLQFPASNVDRLVREEGVSNARILANTRVKDLEMSMTSVNRLFGSHATIARRIYFSPIRMLRIKALSVYFKRCLDTHRIPDITIIDVATVSRHVQSLDIWNESTGEVDDIIKQNKIEFSTSKFTRFRRKLETVVSSIKGCRGISLDYLIRSEDPVNLANPPIEDPSPDVNSLDFMRLNTTHQGPEFEKDNQDLFTLLRHYLTGTDGWNVISRYSRNRNGRNAFLALRAHYEGDSFNDLLKSRASIMMARTFYRGDNVKFKWENYVTIHLEAHEMFFDAKDPLGESIKILNFKSGIRPEAGLESSIDVARGNPEVNRTFDKYVAFLTEGVANRRGRKELFKNSSHQREVASYGRGGGRGRGGRGRGRGFGRGFGRNFNPRGRGRGRSRYHPYQRHSNIPQSIFVEGKALYPSKTYSHDEYKSLSEVQKRELRKARYGEYEETYNARSISAAISQGIREALSTNDDVSSVTQQIQQNQQISAAQTEPHNDSQENMNRAVSYDVSANSTNNSTDQFRSRRTTRRF